ncbi:MAG TPA: HdeD family acid-resistance protein [Ktedonobacterales bacterium]|nr:HdeD family acid-resistance protein [Ktedonobacterales bacterium]
MDTLLARHWWAVGLRGLAAIIFGILALVVPSITIVVLIAFFGAYALVDGIIAVYLAIRGRENNRNWGWLLVEGIAGILIGILAFRWPGVTGIVLLAFIAAWAIITGIMEIFEAIELRRVLHNEWLLILSGAASVLFGLLLIIFPGTGALAVVALIGIYAIIFGVLLLGLAWRLRGMAQRGQVA